MFRPAKLGKEPRYGPSDPGHEYIPGVTETWLGPLAERFGIEGERATLDERVGLYGRMSPDWGTLLLPQVGEDRYRPVHGGNFHASKQLDAWLAGQTPADRAKAERVFAECARDAAVEAILPRFESRTGHAGAGKVPAEAMAVLFKHVTAADGRYHLHVLAEFHNVGRGPDGKLRAVSSYHLFERQWVYSVEFEGRLIGRFHRELGVTLTRTAHGLEVKGMEALRGVKTPRQERIDQVLSDRGLPRTPKTLHWAAQGTHTEGERAKSAEEAVDRTRKWLRDKKLTFQRAAEAGKEAGETISRLVKERRAQKAIRAAVRAVDRVGRHVSREDFSAFARYEAARLRADPAVFEAKLARVLASPGRAKLLTLANGWLTTRGIERARRAWERDFKAVARGRGRRVKPLSFQKARLEAGAPDVRVVAEAERHLARRGVRVAHADQALRIAVRAYRADGRRVLAVGTGAFGRRVGHSAREPVRDADRLARDVSKASALRVFLEVRRHRWRSLDHVVRLVREARKPAIKLSKKDVLVVHTGEVSHRAMKTLLSAARRAKATVVLVNPENPALEQTRGRERGQGGRER